MSRQHGQPLPYLREMTGGLSSNLAAGAGGPSGAFLIEVILTFIFLFTILGVTSDSSKGGAAGIVIGCFGGICF